MSMEDLHILDRAFGTNVCYYKRFLIPRISINEDSVALNLDSVGKEAFRVFLSKDRMDTAMRLIFENRMFHSSPYLSFQSWVYDEKGKLRKDLKSPVDAFRKTAELVNEKFEWDYKGGRVLIMPYLPVVNKVSNEELSDFIELLKILCVTEENYHTMERYIAQFAFERRKKNRPTLIMHGVRGSGKNFFIENILAKIWRVDYRKCGNKFDNFVTFTRNKLAFFDEIRSMENENMFDMLKNISGAETQTIREMYSPEMNVEGKTYIVITSNGKPLHIPYKERPVSKRENQWFVVQFDQELEPLPKFQEIREKYGVQSLLDEFIDRCLGYYLKEIILPIYKKEFLGNNKRPRYGFEIPINEALTELVRMGETDQDIFFWKIVEDLIASNEIDYMDNSRQRSTTEVKLWQYYSGTDYYKLFDVFKKHGVILSSVVVALTEKSKYNAKNFKHFLEKQQLMLNENVVVSGARGWHINVEKAKEFINDAINFVSDDTVVAKLNESDFLDFDD